ncbi:MAG TPA: ATP-binding protein [Actinomycetota bacterium]|nr:ATP-binding protein [Actinomycetota bacterium]
MAAEPEPGGELAGLLTGLADQVARAVARRRAVDPEPEDRFRGLYVSDAHVDVLLAGGRPGVGPEAGSGSPAVLPGGTFARLAACFELVALDLGLLLVALAPDLDPRFEQLYGYLHDDVSRRRASTGLALELCGIKLADGAGRGRFHPSAPLVSGGLLLVEEPDRPFLTRPLRVPDRVTGFLLGDGTPDPLLEALRSTPVIGAADPAPVRRCLAAGARLVYLREGTGSAAAGLGAAALQEGGGAAVVLDLHRADAADLVELAGVAGREARLLGGGLVVGPLEAVGERVRSLVRALAMCRCPVVLHGTPAWDPAWTRAVPALLDAPAPGAGERIALWRSALDSAAGLVDPAAIAGQFRLSPEQVFRAADAARHRAVAEERPLSPADLQAGARAQNAAGLERLARRIRPQVGWTDLVLPAVVLAQLHELAMRAGHREQVLDTWGMGARSSRGRGITAVFAGDSGVGKTLSAEVLAAELGLDLYVIDLSSVVDKYIGETEKNLDRIFAEADRVNGVLLFDEADALFGKRSEVRDAHDRYANVEVAYLLQRMETFEGLAILTTNLRSNLDDAFTRRLDAIVDFPMPEEDDRLRLWQANLPSGLPVAGDLDTRFLAKAFAVSGGNIRNIALSAAYLAAGAGRGVEMADLVRATEREYRKLGRLCVPAEFGAYYPLIATPA